jgi:hypothetical protein
VGVVSSGWRSADVSSVVDRQNRDLALLVVDRVQHSVGTSTGGEDADTFVAQLQADAVRVLTERARDELA